MRVPRHLAAGACCLILSGAFAACGSSNSDSGPGGSSTSASASTSSAGSSTAVPKLNGQSLVYVNYGGESADAAKAAWVDPFGAASGARMAMDAPSDPAKVKAMVQGGNTTWDLIDLDAGTIATNCGTLFEKRGSGVDVSEIDPKYLHDPCGVPIMVQAIALVYNKAKFGNNPPTKITDFMDTKKYPGKRTLFNYAVGGIEPLLLADGTAPDQLYPLNLDRAAAAIKKLGSNLVLQSTLAQQAQSLESGDFSLCLCYTARAAIAASKGANIGVVWDHAYLAYDELAAVKGSKSSQAQQAFLNYVAQPQPQVEFSKHLPYAPTTKGANVDGVNPAYKPYIPQGHEAEMNTPATYDAAWWGVKANTDKAFAAWTAMTAG